MNMVLQSYPAVNNLKPLFQADLDKQVSQSVSYRGREDFLSVLHAPDDVVVDVVDARSGVNIFTHTDIIVCKCPEVNYHHYFILYIYFQIYIAGAFISDTSNRDFPRPFIKTYASTFLQLWLLGYYMRWLQFPSPSHTKYFFRNLHTICQTNLGTLLSRKEISH